ncbi:MAG: enoyl-CoA hydratase/isomerase family protein [Gemmatimonadales bacterium]
MSRYEHVLVTRRDGVGTVTLNRPEKLNAFAARMREEIAEALREMAAADDVRVIVVTGAGRAFSSGADIGYMRDLMERNDVDGFRLLVEAGREAVLAVRSAPKPVIASVNGAAAGGGANLVLSCDFRIASERASIGQTFNKIGLHPDWGGTYFLPRVVGAAKALELIMSGEMIDAWEAQRIGIFNRVVPHERLAHETAETARFLAAKPPLALALAKRAVYDGANRSLEESLEVELEHQLECFASEDAREGLEAFLEKRDPRFRGE